MKNQKYKILVVDDDPTSLCIMKKILGRRHKLIFATSAAGALEFAELENPDLILLDVVMPGMDGFELCHYFKSLPATSKTPIIFVTGMGEDGNEKLGFSLGAVDYITKPFSPDLLKARVNNHLELANNRILQETEVRKATAELRLSQNSAVFMLAEAGHFHDVGTGAHIWRMAVYATILAQAAGWSKQQAGLLSLAAPLHDTGKIGISEAILKAPRPLNEVEWEVMRMHPLIGYKILIKSTTPLFQMAAEIALAHHEKWDGTGYPNGLTGKAIPESARIVALADVFDALTMARPYKPGWTVENAMDHIRKESGSHFDPDLVDVMEEVIWKFRAAKKYYEKHESGENSNATVPYDIMEFLQQELKLI